jgi:5-methylcytosine-specific restriction endonuclease McrA
MSVDTPKRCRLRLDPERYRALKMKILERDGWKCQYCGRRDQLQIHHMIRRSQLGADGEENLIVLCRGFHHWLHSGRHAE